MPIARLLTKYSSKSRISVFFLFSSQPLYFFTHTDRQQTGRQTNRCMRETTAAVTVDQWDWRIYHPDTTADTQPSERHSNTSIIHTQSCQSKCHQVHLHHQKYHNIWRKQKKG